MRTLKSPPRSYWIKHAIGGSRQTAFRVKAIWDALKAESKLLSSGSFQQRGENCGDYVKESTVFKGH